MSAGLASPAALSDPASVAGRRCARREGLIARRMALTLDTHRLLSQAVLAHLVGALPQIWPGTIALYWPQSREISLLPLARRILAAGGEVALPAPTGEAGPLRFRAWTPGEPLATGPQGVPYPRDGHQVRPDVLMIALAGFDAANRRLGYGDGYEPLLAAPLRPLAIGVGFELMRLASVEPLPHDVPLDMIVTEAGVFRRDRPTA
jgi:5-formyltetrahydrofolate cyclo-ligase